MAGRGHIHEALGTAARTTTRESDTLQRCQTRTATLELAPGAGRWSQSRRLASATPAAMLLLELLVTLAPMLAAAAGPQPAAAAPKKFTVPLKPLPFVQPLTRPRAMAPSNRARAPAVRSPLRERASPPYWPRRSSLRLRRPWPPSLRPLRGRFTIRKPVLSQSSF